MSKKKIGVIIIVAASIFLYASVSLFVFADSTSDVIWNSSYLIVDLLLVAGGAMGSRYIIKKAKLGRVGKLAIVAVVTIALLVFLFPVTARQNGFTCRGTAETCGDLTSGKWAASTEWNSVSAQFWCFGGSYQFNSLDGLQFWMKMSCPPALGGPISPNTTAPWLFRGAYANYTGFYSDSSHNVTETVTIRVVQFNQTKIQFEIRGARGTYAPHEWLSLNDSLAKMLCYSFSRENATSVRSSGSEAISVPAIAYSCFIPNDYGTVYLGRNVPFIVGYSHLMTLVPFRENWFISSTNIQGLL